MNICTFSDLPPAPKGKTGWPWTEESERLPDQMPDGSDWPRISIVTPSYNQGKFIEETIRSILLQGYSNLEYIVIDGSSNDETVMIIEKYSRWISYWCSEKDDGQTDAINKGFRYATG
ncbi:MAG: glycosyltransferase, partial [Dolichospermum sp.]